MNQVKSNSLFKNTIALYVRMLFSVCVNIYISRVVLEMLGVDDYGIYSVVGGIVILLSFINSSMSGSTSRFLSIAIGEGCALKIQEIYNSAKHLHGAIAILILILGETIGVWLINSYLEIPSDRIVVANWLFQLSVFTTIFSILHVPYTAMIISMELMDVYAKIEIVNILMKLGVVLLLMNYPYDRLLMYGFLLLIEGGFIFYIYKMFCKKNFGEYTFNWKLNRDIILSMSKFSGWDLLGWGGFTMSTQGRQIFINKFFGLAINAAGGMANTASTAITTFTNNVVMAFRPRIMKSYGIKEYDKMQYLVEIAMIAVILLMTIIIVPMYYKLDWILHLWLVDVPPYTLDFCRLLLFVNFVEAINNVIKIGIHASGRMRAFTMGGFIIHFGNILFTFFAFKWGYSVVTTYSIALFLAIINLGLNFYFFKRNIPQIDIYKLICKMISALFICTVGMVVAILSEKISLNDYIDFFVIFIVNLILTILLSSVIYKREFVNLFKSILIKKHIKI